MTFDVLIRHSDPVATGEGMRHSFEYRHVDASSEEDAFRRTRQSLNDHIACIDSWHHHGVTPFSVEIRDPDFFSDVHCPEHAADEDGERRAG
ncbi:hypothetical protein [Magnetospirillum sp. UT-4]|uniref:hypothetical protein n=1 Tax=Magnetospirillum sp. UT-4 TaxID=2681467 RepID=UPI001380D210|nr:hypothetical protein [Magnetospirillum sp. UT-4]CAA7616928.1 hypothetical protein MTBUT4_240059 [Magnetospirillum sp. UT-4]